MLPILDRLLRGLAVILLLSLLASVVAGVISRQIGAPLAWSDELAQYLLVWTGFCGWMIATRKRGHIRITVFADKLPAFVATGLELATQLAMIALGAGLAWYSIALINRTWDIESVSVPMTAAFLYLPLPALGLLTMAQGALEFANAARGSHRIDGGQIL